MSTIAHFTIHPEGPLSEAGPLTMYVGLDDEDGTFFLTVEEREAVEIQNSRVARRITRIMESRMGDAQNMFRQATAAPMAEAA